uniref:RRM domain-containing protein n=1 Tax=Meloidogyne javanica TaxID=6303 RepID=A0A915MI11_MELJA
NLGPAATTSPSIVEEELKSVFGVFPGFSRIRMHTKRGSPVAFVEFFEVGQAVHVMHALQGFGLSANNGVGTGIRIEFAKTRMGDTFLSKYDGMGGRGDR